MVTCNIMKTQTKNFLANFVGKRVGAIGVSYSVTENFSGENQEEAHLSIYDKYEHLQFLQMAEVVEKGIGVGTCNFVGIGAALGYYDCEVEEVDAKIREKAITIGWPKFEYGQKLQIDKDGRFWILVFD